jgi:hypothetical protein
MADKKKIIIYVGLSVIALTGGFLIYKYFQKGSEGKITPVPQPLPKPENEIESGLFPLRKGSYNNKYVAILQDALGVTADGDFGPITYDALKSKTGKVQISNYEDLMATIDYLNGMDDASALEKENKTLRLIQDYKSNAFGYLNIVLNSDSVFRGLTLSGVSTSFTPTKFVLNLKSGQKLSLKDYELYSVASNGDLIIYCNKGKNIGYWQVNPNNVELK